MCILQHYDLQCHIGEVSASLYGYIYIYIHLYIYIFHLFDFNVDSNTVCGTPTNLSLNMSTIEWP